MHKAIIILAATVSTIAAAPALADDAGIDRDSMVEQSKPRSINAVTPTVKSFNIKYLGMKSTSSFMATTTGRFEQEYRLNVPRNGFEAEPSAGLVGLIVPEEFAFSSNAQDTGLDVALPGQFLSSSTRADFISQSGPVSRDKSSLGVRFGF
ncbi:MAG: hypothetical protein Pars2KO_31170 [Parasphingorhabdus sp.]